MKELLIRTLLANREKYINRLLKLVEIDTRDIGHGIEGGLEGNGQKYLIDVFKELGADEIITDQLREEVIQKAIEMYHEGNPGHNYDNRYNVYATFKGEGGRSIMFNGHIDNLPAENEEAWDSPPLQPIVKDGKMHGIGICDMKSGLMASIMAVELLKDAGVKLPGDVKIVSVVDEEGGGNGSIAAAMNGQRADAVVVCEPTNYELIAAHMGFVFFKVEVSGVAVHSGLKLSGVNAIEKAAKIMAAIDELEHKWLLKYKHPLLPPPSSNVGVIYGGEAGSTIPDYCCFKTCVHYHPNQMSYEQVVAEYTNAIKLCCAGDEWLKGHMPQISIYQAGGPFEMDLGHEFVGAFKSAYKSAMDKEVKVVGSPAGCDSRTWRNIAECPTLQYGPGSLEQCHTVNEYVTVDQYLNAILIYANLILEWCKR
jgi:acetylornithine deacetylase